MKETYDSNFPYFKILFGFAQELVQCSTHNVSAKSNRKIYCESMAWQCHVENQSGSPPYICRRQQVKPSKESYQLPP